MNLLGQSRPPGYAARGTSLGLFGLAGLSAAIPTLTLISLFPIYVGGIDLMLASLPYVLGSCFIFSIIITLGLHKRRLWYIYFMFTSGCLLLILYVIGFILALMVMFRLIPLQEPDLYFVSYSTTVCWVLAGIFAWFTYRMIRLRYWQPWTTPEQWEPGDEAGPRWAQRMRERRTQERS